MKNQILLHLAGKFLQKWRGSDRSFRRKVYIGVGVFSFFAVSLTVLSIYLAFKLGSFALEQARVAGTKIYGEIHQTNPEVRPLLNNTQNSRTVLQTCSATLMGLLSPQPWIQKPLPQLFDSIKNSCWPGASAETPDWEV